MNTPRYCFTERGAALFRYLGLQSHINTQINYHARRRPQSLQRAIVAKRPGRMWTSWVLPKKAMHMHAHWTLLGTWATRCQWFRHWPPKKCQVKLTALLQPVFLSLARAGAATRPSLRISSQYP